MNSLFDISGKKAIVTGASRGLGKGIAEAYLEAGCDVVFMSRTIQEKDVLREKNIGKAYAVSGDISNREALKGMFNKAMDYLGDVDILVTAAGVQKRHRSDKFPLDDWDEVIEVNLTSVFILGQLCAEKMVEKGKGKIINIASMNSWFGGINVPAYTASKGGVMQLTRGMSNDLAAFGVNINAIAPGYMETEMNINLINDKDRYQEILNRIPAKRWGGEEDLKGTAIFLASAASDYLNGAIIPVDGGYLCR